MMKQFIIGQVYECRSLCDYDCVWSYKVIERTASTITLKNQSTGKMQKNRISARTSQYFGAETVYPLGKYSMCPILTADK